MSQEDGVRLNPLVSNPEQTLKQLKEDESSEAKMNIFASAISGAAAQNEEEKNEE